MPDPRQASPLRLALGSALLCVALLALRGIESSSGAALQHELRWSTQTPERTAQRFLDACAARQLTLARALASPTAIAGAAPCPALPHTLDVHTVFTQSERAGETGLRLRGTVALDGAPHRLDVELQRAQQRWLVASTVVAKR